MARCGCTNPCPACPQSVYLDMMDDAVTPLTLAITGVPLVTTLITRVVNIPAGLPGLGTTIVAEWNACAPDDQSTMTVAWAILVDGAVIQSRTILAWLPGQCEGLPIIAGVQQLAPGNRTIVLQVTAATGGGTGDLNVLGAAMRTDLIRSDSLVVTGGP